MSDAIEMVLVDQSEGWRPVGIVSAAELEELERAHDAGDLRAEARLELIRRGRPATARALVAPAAPPPGFWHNCRDACGAEGCVGWGTRPGEIRVPPEAPPPPRRRLPP